MPSEITMPQLSDTMEEGTVVKWHKKEGDAVKAGDEIADIETDKATMPMEAFDSGVLAYIAVHEGEKIKVGGLLGAIAIAGEQSADVRQRYANAPPRPEQPAADNAPPPPAVPPSPAAVADSAPADSRVRVSPLARKIASEKGIPLEQIAGSGPGGRIVQRDVLAHTPTVAAGRPASQPRAVPKSPAVSIAPGQTQKLLLTKMRAAIAAALQRSKQTIPHFYETVDIDMENVVQLRAWMNKALEAEGVKLSLADFVAKAVAIALARHPAMNATFNGTEITRYGDVNLGIAVALPDGLIVPVLRGVGQMDLRRIRRDSVDLIDRARQQRLKQHEQTGATFTITNLGQYGVRQFAAVINPPEVGILAVGAAEKRPVVRGDQIVPRTIMTVTLSADHRAVDGAVAAEFLKTLRELLEEPGALVL